MDAFEQIVELYLQEKNYWTRHSVKVELTKEEKKKIKLPTIARPEIDLVAYNPNEDVLILIEAKSFLNSKGVTIGGLKGTDKKTKDRYRLLNNKKYQAMIEKKLKCDYKERKLIGENTEIKFALAAGQVQKKSEKKVKAFLHQKRYLYFAPDDIKKTIKGFANRGWENEIVTVAAKLML